MVFSTPPRSLYPFSNFQLTRRNFKLNRIEENWEGLWGNSSCSLAFFCRRKRFVCFCYAQFYPLESLGLSYSLRVLMSLLQELGTVSLAIPPSCSPQIVFSRLLACRGSRCLTILEWAPAAWGAEHASWHLAVAGSPCLPGARWPQEPGQESTEPSLLFKRLVHWSSDNAEFSLGCLFPGKLGTIGESGRSAHSKVAFQETGLIMEY